MPRSAAAVEKFFQLSLLGLVASGFFAVAGSGYLDAPTTILTAANSYSFLFKQAKIRSGFPGVKYPCMISSDLLCIFVR